jgi:hypothetical protein
MPVENVTPYTMGGATDYSAFCRRISPRALGALLWEVDLVFSTKPVGPRKGDPQQQVDNPLLRPPIVRFRTQKAEWVMFQDLDGRPFQNSARMPLSSEKCTRPRSRGLLTIQKNHAYLDYSLLHSHLDTINKRDFYMARPGCARFDDAEADYLFDNGVYFVQMVYSFLIEPLGWNSGFVSGCVDAGPYYRDVVSGQPVYFKDKDGIAATDPKFLDGSGYPLDTNTSPPYILCFRKYNETDFAALGL